MVLHLRPGVDQAPVHRRPRQHDRRPAATSSSRRCSGARSLLLLEGDEHLRRRKLMLPAVPRRADARLRAGDRARRPSARSPPGRWASEFALHPSMQAITLEVILRGGLRGRGRPRAASVCATASSAILARAASPAGVRARRRRRLRRLPPYRRIREPCSTATDELLYAEIAERRADPDLAERDDILSLLVAARFEDGSAMSDARAARPADDAAARRPRDDRDRARLDLRPAAAPPATRSRACAAELDGGRGTTTSTR